MRTGEPLFGRLVMAGSESLPQSIRPRLDETRNEFGRCLRRRNSIQEHTMDLDRDKQLGASHADPAFDGATAVNTTGMNPLSNQDSRVYDRDTSGSNFLAFLIGGLVIAVGLLAFLFYDGGNTRDVTTTGSL